MRIVSIFIGSRMNPLNLFKTRSNVCTATGAYTLLHEVLFSPVFLTNQMVLRKMVQVKGDRVTLSGCGGLYVMTPYISVI